MLSFIDRILELVRFMGTPIDFSGRSSRLQLQIAPDLEQCQL